MQWACDGRTDRHCERSQTSAGLPPGSSLRPGLDFRHCAGRETERSVRDQASSFPLRSVLKVATAPRKSSGQGRRSEIISTEHSDVGVLEPRLSFVQVIHRGIPVACIPLHLVGRIHDDISNALPLLRTIERCRMVSDRAEGRLRRMRDDLDGFGAQGDRRRGRLDRADAHGAVRLPVVRAEVRHEVRAGGQEGPL